MSEENVVKFKFENLRIWQLSMDFAEDLNLEVIQKFPQKEIYNLSSQTIRAADSIALNISEGAIGQSNPEQKRFMGYAVRSLAEVVTCLHKAKRRAYIDHIIFDKHYNAAFNLMNMMIAFKSKLAS